MLPWDGGLIAHRHGKLSKPPELSEESNGDGLGGMTEIPVCFLKHGLGVVKNGGNSFKQTNSNGCPQENCDKSYPTKWALGIMLNLVALDCPCGRGTEQLRARGMSAMQTRCKSSFIGQCVMGV